MKAIAVNPGKANSIHLREVPTPSVGSVNANREYFEVGAKDLSQAELQYPAWLSKLLTHPVKGLANYQTLLKTLTEGKDVIKVFCEVAPL